MIFCLINLLIIYYGIAIKNKDQMKYFGPTSNNPGADIFNRCQYSLSPEKYNHV